MTVFVSVLLLSIGGEEKDWRIKFSHRKIYREEKVKTAFVMKYAQ